MAAGSQKVPGFIKEPLRDCHRHDDSYSIERQAVGRIDYSHKCKRASLNNAEFFEGLRNQDPAAAKQLSECFVPVIWRFVYLRVRGDRHLAEDIVAESVLALVAAAASGTEVEYPTAWLRAVALRRVQDHFRAAARVQHLIERGGTAVKLNVQQTPATEHDRQLEREEVRAALDRLPEPYRLALEWKYIDRLSVREIAARLNASEKGTESILFRARKCFRSEFTKPELPPSQPSPTPLTSKTFKDPLAQDPADDRGAARGDDDDIQRPSFPNEMTRTRS